MLPSNDSQALCEARDQVEGMEAYIVHLKEVLVGTAIQSFKLGRTGKYSSTEEGILVVKRLANSNMR